MNHSHPTLLKASVQSVSQLVGWLCWLCSVLYVSGPGHSRLWVSYIHTDGLYSFIHKGTLIFLQWSHMLRIWGVTRCQNRQIPTLFCPIWSSKGALWTNICVVATVFHYWGLFKYKDLLCFYLVSFSIVFTCLFLVLT